MVNFINNNYLHIAMILVVLMSIGIILATKFANAKIDKIIRQNELDSAKQMFIEINEKFKK